MSSVNSSRSSLIRWCRRTKWTAFVLSLSLIPHAALAAARGDDSWPDSLITVHVASACVAVVVAVMFYLTRWLGDRTVERVQDAYDAGRATSMAAELANLEHRIDQRG